MMQLAKKKAEALIERDDQYDKERNEKEKKKGKSISGGNELDVKFLVVIVLLNNFI
jgi:hypothetical protein